jgi:putative ABC transport system permease protein
MVFKAMFQAVLQDLRFGWRLLRKQPTFAAVTILTLALGIGVNTAIGSVVNAVLLDPWPYEELDELIALRGSFETDPTTWVSYLEFHAWQERSRAFEAIAAHRQMGDSLEYDGVTEAVLAVEASANLFEMLGTEPYLGRTFTAEEDQLGAAGVVVLSYPFWQRRFGGRRDILGEILRVEGRPSEVIGVMKPEMVYPHDFRSTALWLPIEQSRDEEWGWNYETHGGISVTGRLKDGVDLAAARADMDRIATELAAEQPGTHKGRGVSARPALERSFGDLRPRLLALAAAVLLVLAIACVNVANLLLVRSAGRTHELAVRRALGASRRRIVRQLLTESLLLSLAGGVLGLAVAWATLRGLVYLAQLETMTAFREISIDGRILLLTALVAVLTGLVVGVAPAFGSVRVADVRALYGGIKSSSGRRRGLFTSSLVVAEVGLALVILICAVLSVRSFYRVVYDDPGFDPENLMTFSFVLPDEGYPEDEDEAAFVSEMLENLSRLPGVEAATTTVPIVAYWSTTFEIVGRPPGENKLSAQYFEVSAGFFKTMGVELLKGRSFLPSDRADAPLVVVVDEGFAATYWPGEDAVGQRIRLGSDPPSSPGREVVGVVGRAAYDGVHKGAEATFFEPAPQVGGGSAWAVLRTSVEPAGLAETLRTSMQVLDPNVALHEFWTMDYRLSIHRSAERLAAALLGGFAVLAFALAAIGLYGVMAGSVAGRQRELGIRLALGASRDDLVRLVLGRGLVLTALGVVLGWILAAAGVRLLASQLYATDPYDPMSWLGLTLVVALGAAGACAVPAWRAGRVRAATVLRGE